MDPTVTASSDIIAMVGGKPLTEVPRDLFIPPDALEILLDSFSGPLDLLWYLIRRENIDIMDIPIESITRQYTQYIELMELARLELAADYLVMAAWLAEIKSRLLLPKMPAAGEEMPEEDPRMALVRRLQAYEQFKEAATTLDILPRLDRDFFHVGVSFPYPLQRRNEPKLELASLVAIYTQLLQQQSMLVHHRIERELITVEDRISSILLTLEKEGTFELSQLFTRDEGRIGLIVSLLAILELARQSLIIIDQKEIYCPVYFVNAP